MQIPQPLPVNKSKNMLVKLRTLASELDNQPIIAKDETIIRQITSYLKSKNNDFTTIALQTVYFLSSHPNCRKSLSTHGQLVKQIQFLRDSKNKTIHRFSRDILGHLQKYLDQGEDHQTGGEEGSGEGRPEEENNNSTFQPKYLNTTVFKVDSMDCSDKRVNVEKALLNVTGVVSVTIDRHMRRVIVYTSRPSSAQEGCEVVENMHAAISELKMSGHMEKEKTKTPRLSTRGGYLDEEAAEARPTKRDPEKKTLAEWFDGENTLEARMARQRKLNFERMSKQHQTRSFLSTVKSWVW
eukprot:33177_1